MLLPADANNGEEFLGHVLDRMVALSIIEPLEPPRVIAAFKCLDDRPRFLPYVGERYRRIGFERVGTKFHQATSRAI